MRKNNFFIKVLAITGIVFVWLPILAPFLFSAIRLLLNRRFLYDYLLPAELFPVAFLGGILLIWAALLKNSYRKIIGLSFTIASASLISGQTLAVITGLASGKTEPTGWQWLLVILSIIIYILALGGTGVGGILLLRKLIPGSRAKKH